jgi:hypothetical protein
VSEEHVALAESYLGMIVAGIHGQIAVAGGASDRDARLSDIAERMRCMYALLKPAPYGCRYVVRAEPIYGAPE